MRRCSIAATEGGKGFACPCHDSSFTADGKRENGPSPRDMDTLDTRQKLLDAAVSVIRSKGYATTTVEDLCAKAGVAKGSFFHHFKDKEALATAAAEYWSETTGAFCEAAPYHRYVDPLDRAVREDFPVVVKASHFEFQRARWGSASAVAIAGL